MMKIDDGGAYTDLVSAAWQAREQAYAPYSGFAVGAAVQTGSGNN